MPFIHQAIRFAVKSFKVKNEAINPKTGTVNADKVATFTEKASRHGKRGYVKNGHQLSTHAYSRNAGLRNYVKSRQDKKDGQVGSVSGLSKEEISFIDMTKSVATAGQALGNKGVNDSAAFILNGSWAKDSYSITPELAAHVRYIADRLGEAKLDARAANKPEPAAPKVFFG